MTNMSDVAVISRLRFDPSIERSVSRPEGATLAEIVAEEMAGAVATDLDFLVVSLHGPQSVAVVERHHWHLVRPKAGTTVTLRMRPAGGGALRSVLSIAIMAATAVFAAWALPVIGALGTALASAAIGIGANYLLSSIFQRDDKKPEDKYTIAGTRNQANPWGPVPQIYGQHRVYPPYWAFPFTRVIGDEQYLVALFVIGEGQHSLEQFRIGETGIDAYHDITTEIRYGLDTDTPITLYEEVTFEDAVGVELAFDDGFSIRTTASNVDAISVDIYFPGGLFWTDADGELREMAASCEVQYRRKGVDFAPDGPWVYVDVIFVNAAKKESFWRTLRWEVDGGPGTFDVQIKRGNVESDDSNTTDTMQWTVVRGMRYQHPVNYPRPLCLVAVQIKASKQLSGTIDTFSVVASSHIPDWNGSAWVSRPTSNPASVYRHVLQGHATALARSDAEVNLDALAEWHAWCESKSLTYQRVHDFDASVRDVLQQVSAAGRATPSQPVLGGGKWSVVIDRIQTVLRAHITPRNAHSFSGEVNYQKLPDAYRVKFLNRTKFWTADERIVLRPGLVGDPQLYEEIEFPGQTMPWVVDREAKRRFLIQQNRYETWYAAQDFEHLVAPRGSLVRVSYPVLAEGMMDARVTGIDSAFMSDGERRIVSLDERVTMVDGTDYVVRFRLADGTSSLWTIETVAGETDEVILVSGSGSEPAIGDLALFGVAGSESFECVIANIEAQRDLGARLTLVRHAPEIESLADA
ncbi:hypothetical protein SAMN02745157_4868 [Kaistia soli DSM 19436]|uniref:Tip attachment protein J HDII-ins2 domain-containing protein n=2 Tax=Kaistia TaxID=166953 RepID=A0A1M5MT91_9HYPH|nr:hypothetical protein SAMN02745157_4868 [Kaistia soli DSM 19436]